MHFIHDRLSGAKRQRRNEKMIGVNVYNNRSTDQIEGAEAEGLISSRLVGL